jgi:LysR family hydrogen peroxide-inducible transcriptional activator
MNLWWSYRDTASPSDWSDSMQHLPSVRHLRHLIALADHGHFCRAAEACCVTQSNLSDSIKELENVLEATLVDRTKR